MEVEEYRPHVCFDPAYTKLRFVISEISIIRYKIPDYEEECLYVLYDYLLIFMKTLLRAIAEQNRKFRLVECPVLTGKEVKKKEPDTKKPWEMKILWHKMSKDIMEMIKKNDESEEDSETESKRKKETDTGTKAKKHKKNSSDSNEEDDEDEDADDDKKKKEGDKKEETNRVTEIVKSEFVYSCYTAKDLLELLKENPDLVPKRSVRRILTKRAVGRVEATPFNV